MIDSWTKGRLIVRDWESLRGRDKGRQQRCWYVSSVSWAQDFGGGSGVKCSYCHKGEPRRVPLGLACCGVPH